MRTGIYGGTFNPIHRAHIHLVREFAKRLSLDRILLIPTGTPPHKAAKQLASNEDRIQMLRLAAAEVTECPVEISEIEMRREGKSYTADTLTQLKALYPGDELFLLMGEDMFLTIDQWYQPERIFRAAVICGAPRDFDSMHKLQAIQAYGVWQEKKLYGKVSMGVVRTTFIIDEQGCIERVMPKVKPDTNAAEILAYLQ